MAAVLDKCIQVVIAAAPVVTIDVQDEIKLKRFLSLAVRDRRSRRRGNLPIYITFIGDAEEGALINYREFRGWEDAPLDKILASFDRYPNFRNEVMA